MENIVTIAIFICGAIVASFVGVVVARLSTGQSFLRGRSRCDACGEPLSFLSLIPIVSYAISRGRARCCGARVSPIAPLSEIVLGTLFVLAYLKVGLSLLLCLLLIAVALIVALVLYDLAHQILPPSLTFLFVTAAVGVSALSSSALSDFGSTLVTALILALILAGIHYVSGGRAMGLADAPFVFGLALIAGSTALSGFIF